MAPSVKVAIRIGDFALLHSVLERLKPAGFALRVLAPDESPPRGTGLLLVAPGAATEGLPQLEVTELDLLAFRVRYKLAGQPSLVAGVDPGGRTGVAVVGRGRALLARECATVAEAVALLVRVAHVSRLTLVRVGRGAPAQGSRLVQGLQHHGLTVELVDEAATGSGNHAAAAERIAKLAGHPATGVAHTPTEGEIADLQRRSRRLSRGRRTISRDTARRVAEGEISLEEALAGDGG